MLRTLTLSMGVLALSAVAAPSASWAQAADTFGFGSRSTALGGAVAADVEDSSAPYYNPAGIVRSDGIHVGLGYVRAIPSLSINGRDSNVDVISGLNVGLTVPGSIGGFRFAFGLATHLPDSRLSRSRTLPRRQPRWELYDNRPHRTFIATVVAVRPVDWLMVGAGLSFLAQSKTTLELRGTIDFQDDSATRLEHQLKASLVSVRYPVLGVQITPNEQLSFGLTYRDEFQLGNDLDADVVATIDAFGISVPAALLLETFSVNVFVPRQLSLGASYTPFPWLRVSAELTWLDWSNYQSAIGDSDVQLIIEPPPELAGVINVPESIPSTRSLPAEFEDQFVPRLGVEVKPLINEDLTLAFRAGYYYESSPVPDQSGFSNLIDTDHHTLTLGAGVALTNLRPTMPGSLSLDAHFQWTALPERIHVKDSLVDPVGDLRGSGNVLSAGVSLELAFE